MSARVGQTSGTNEEETTPLTIGEDDGMTRADDESYVKDCRNGSPRKDCSAYFASSRSRCT